MWKRLPAWRALAVAMGDRGLQWQERGRLPSAAAALVAAGPRLLYAATHGGDILRSDDGGAT